jgi:hypothetical protein
MPAEMPHIEQAWECPCGHLNRGTFGADGVNDGQAYSVCGGCHFEIRAERDPAGAPPEGVSIYVLIGPVVAPMILRGAPL